MKRYRTVGLVFVMVVAASCGGPVSDMPTPPPLHPPLLPQACVPPAPPAAGDLVHQRLASPLSPIDAKQFRAALEHRFQGMSGEGAFVGIAPTIVAIEAASVEEMKKCGCCPQVPFGHSRDEWTAFKTEIRTGDSVVYFRNNNERWRVLGGAEGYAIVRSAQVVRSFLLSMN